MIFWWKISFKVQLSWEGHKNVRNHPYTFEIYIANVNTMRTIAQIFVIYSEKLNFTDIASDFYSNIPLQGRMAKMDALWQGSKWVERLCDRISISIPTTLSIFWRFQNNFLHENKMCCMVGPSIDEQWIKVEINRKFWRSPLWYYW